MSTPQSTWVSCCGQPASEGTGCASGSVRPTGGAGSASVGGGGAQAALQTLILHSEEFPSRRVDMPGADGVTIRELLTPSVGAMRFCMRLFEVAPGGHTPYHTHDYEHEVFILDGEGEIAGDGGGGRPLRRGDALLVPATVPHQFRNTGAKPLRFLCLIPALRG